MSKQTTRTKILDAAFHLFYRGGIRATSVDRVIEDAGVTRMTLYKHFASKQELIEEVLRRRDAEWFEWFKARVEAISPLPSDRPLAVFDALGEWFGEKDFRGCAFINAAGEFSEEGDAVNMISARHMRALSDYLISLCREAGLDRAESLGADIALVVEGAIVQAAVSRDPQAASRARAIAEILLTRATK